MKPQIQQKAITSLLLQAVIDLEILATEEKAAEVVATAKRAAGNGKMAARQLQGITQVRQQLQELQDRAETAERLMQQLELKWTSKGDPPRPEDQMRTLGIQTGAHAKPEP